MDEEVLYVHDRPAIRTRSDAVKNNEDDALGIAYTSTRESLSAGRSSPIFWEDRAPKTTFNLVDQIPLDWAEGRQLVDEAA